MYADRALMYALVGSGSLWTATGATHMPLPRYSLATFSRIRIGGSTISNK
jgi:hypothetical protein